MASSASLANSLCANAITKRLTKINHVTSKAQVLAVLLGARLEGHVSSAVKASPQEINCKENDTNGLNPAYDE
jgi:hypothetical protein